MVLAEDIRDSMGRFLLSKGAAIEEKHIRILKTWGVDEADIEGISHEAAAGEAMADISPEALQKCREYADNYFRHSSMDLDIIKELKRLCVLQFAKKLSTGFDITKPGSLPDKKTYTDETSEKKTEKPLSVQELVRRQTELVSFPDIYFRIVDVINNPRSNISQIVDVISKDPGLCAKLLRIVNSPFLGIPTKVDSITRAVALIGNNELATLALGISVIKYFKDIPAGLVDMQAFWLHSIACGIFAGILAGHKGGLQEERFFIGGLLHDIGRLIMFKGLPGLSTRAIRLSRDNCIPLFEVEKQIFGFDHGKAAGTLLAQWNLPDRLIDMIENHHQPMNCKNVQEASIINFANVMAIAGHFGQGGEHFVPHVAGDAWTHIGLSPGILAIAMSQAERQIYEIMKDFLNEGH